LETQSLKVRIKEIAAALGWIAAPVYERFSMMAADNLRNLAVEQTGGR
jgi:hypothetical protein